MTQIRYNQRQVKIDHVRVLTSDLVNLFHKVLENNYDKAQNSLSFRGIKYSYQDIKLKMRFYPASYLETSGSVVIKDSSFSLHVGGFSITLDITDIRDLMCYVCGHNKWGEFISNIDDYVVRYSVHSSDGIVFFVNKFYRTEVPIDKEEFLDSFTKSVSQKSSEEVSSHEKFTISFRNIGESNCDFCSDVVKDERVIRLASPYYPIIICQNCQVEFLEYSTGVDGRDIMARIL